jgi:pseudaminic acid synthase
MIAELSANHGGSIDIALRTIEAAAKAGADAIKLQTYTPDTLTLKSDKERFVVKTKNAWAGRTLHDLYAEAMTPWEWHAELMACAKSLGMLCFSTPFDPTAVAFLEQLGVPVHKVASFELVDLPLVDAIAATGKPMILSTGMASLGDIELAVRACRALGNDQLALLRCVSSYPARPESMDLNSFEVLRGFGTVVGLSDHTRDATVAIASVTLGAKLIEKHFIVDRNVGGPDSFFSLEPDEFRAMVTAVRDAEKALGKPRFGAGEEERASVGFRRSLFVAKPVRAGEVLTCDVVRSVRPSHGLSPQWLPEILGRVASHDLEAGEPLSFADVGGAVIRPTVSLRPATNEDCAQLLAWRNDEDTRRASLDQAAVSPETHAAWLEQTLASATRTLLVAEHEGVAVGQVRLDKLAGASSEISLTVAPSARGKHLATPMLIAAETFARTSGVVRLVARIRDENVRSFAAFKAAGYYGFCRDTEAVSRCERRIVAYAAPG